MHLELVSVLKNEGKKAGRWLENKNEGNSKSLKKQESNLFKSSNILKSLNILKFLFSK